MPFLLLLSLSLFFSLSLFLRLSLSLALSLSISLSQCTTYSRVGRDLRHATKLAEQVKLVLVAEQALQLPSDPIERFLQEREKKEGAIRIY
jgi:hypothetical protein